MLEAIYFIIVYVNISKICNCTLTNKKMKEPIYFAFHSFPLKSGHHAENPKHHSKINQKLYLALPDTLTFEFHYLITII